MKLYCENCGKEVEFLERYNGKTFCSRCFRASEESSLTVTKENEENFRLSELCLFRYLTETESINSKKRNRRSILEDAIRLCSEAAKHGHPKAVFRMGFYNEYFMEDSKGEAERMMRAFEYYYRVFDAKGELKFATLSQEGYVSKTITSVDELDMLKLEAAKRILEIFRKYDYVFGLREKKDSRFKEARDKIVARYSNLKAMAMAATGGENSIVKAIYKTLSACFDDNVRPPLFGFYRITGAELRELLSIEYNPKEGIMHEMRILSEKLAFRYAFCQANGSFTDRGSAFYRIRNATFPGDRTNQNAVSDTDYVYFTFYNEKGKHGRVRAKYVTDIYNALFDDNSKMAELVSSTSKRELTIFGDDIVWFERNKDGTIVDTLIKNLREEG